MEKELHVPRRMAMKLIVLSVWMPWVDAGCTCKYFDEGTHFGSSGSSCSCGEWTPGLWGYACSSGGDGFWEHCDKISNQGGCEAAENIYQEKFCKWESCDEALASARRGLDAAATQLPPL